MIFTNKIIVSEPHIWLGNSRIERKTTVKYLGLNIDDSLKFNTHLDYLKGKLAQLSGVSYRLKDYFNLRASKNFYFACVYSHITYCLPVFGGWLGTGRREKLVKLQERIVRNLFAKYGNGHCPFKCNNLLKLKDIYKLYACIHMFKIVRQNTNEVVAETMTIDAAPHNYETRGRENIRTPFPRTNGVKHSYKYQFINEWNQIPNDLKYSPSLKIFKRRLSNYFVSMY